MQKPSWFEFKLTLNVIVTVAGFAIAIVLGWSRMEGQANDHAKQILKLEMEDARIRAEIREVREKADAKLEMLTRDMSEVRSALKGISTNIDWIVRQSGKDARAPP
ncbi:hypothetical protein GCM10019059_37640 [Camelimonas fluminis]|uniref:Uncharacterized protein n=1 Tax=Camelimonas fluminis TaxID=1576911 RepID=A0ABV7UNE3_9HYPH|nr:hypothetical protein [Camelimonas fluminis]GHE74598.1 hypothetical protein GCM10019059_37640 [Camelimonas fluminis]